MSSSGRTTSSGQELAFGTNLTGANITFTTVNVPQDIPGCIVAVPASPVRPVYLEAQLTFAHSAAGGLVAALVTEVSNGVDVAIGRQLIFSAPGGLGFVTGCQRVRLGTTARVRNFKLQAVNFGPAGTVTIGVQSAPGAGEPIPDNECHLSAYAA